jgi:hypothetical protein
MYNKAIPLPGIPIVMVKLLKGPFLISDLVKPVAKQGFKMADR